MTSTTPMPSVSPERGRSRSPRQISAAAKSRTPSRPRSFPRRSISPRSSPRSRTPSRTPSIRSTRVGGRNGVKGGRDQSRSPTRSRRSRSGGRGGRQYRDRTHTRSPSRGAPVPKSSKIVVEKLTKNVNPDHLHEIFGAYGAIQDLDLPINSQFMTNRGTAYIVYRDTLDAEAAIAHMHEAQLDGAVISVSIVLPRRKFSRSPPPARRGGPTFDRFEARGPPRGGYRGPPPSYDRPRYLPATLVFTIKIAEKDSITLIFVKVSKPDATKKEQRCRTSGEPAAAKGRTEKEPELFELFQLQ